jgi:hypothetical protein
VLCFSECYSEVKDSQWETKCMIKTSNLKYLLFRGDQQILFALLFSTPAEHKKSKNKITNSISQSYMTIYNEGKIPLMGVIQKGHMICYRGFLQAINGKQDQKGYLSLTHKSCQNWILDPSPTSNLKKSGAITTFITTF